ncbi:hypothetical protein D3C73_1303470 [compost metagenome]
MTFQGVKRSAKQLARNKFVESPNYDTVFQSIRDEIAFINICHIVPLLINHQILFNFILLYIIKL